MTKTNLQKQTTEGTTLREYCLTWGFPCIIMLIISLLSAITIGAQFEDSLFVKLCVFTISLLLQLLLYYTLCQQLPLGIYNAYKSTIIKRQKEKALEQKSKEQPTVAETNAAVPTPEPKEEATPAPSKEAEENEQETADNTPEKAETEAETEVQDTAQPTAEEKPAPPIVVAIPELSSEEYKKRNEEYINKLKEEKTKLVAEIIGYVQYTMACFMDEQNLDAFCKDILGWTENPEFKPQPAKTKMRLTSLEVRHFVWNIGERLGKANGYNGTARLNFVKALFPDVLEGIEDETILNFTVDPDKGRIKLDRPENGSYKFHYSRKQTA